MQSTPNNLIKEQHQIIDIMWNFQSLQPIDITQNFDKK